MQGRLREGRVGSRAFIWLVVVGAAGAGCSASNSGSTMSGFGGSNGTGGAGVQDAASFDAFTGAGGSTGSGGASSSGGSPGTGGAGGLGSGRGGATGAGGSSAFGGSSGAGGVPTGKGGSTGAGGAAGRAGAGGVTGTGGAGGAVMSFCPLNAIFCADFEESSGVPDNAPVGSATFEDPAEAGATFGGASGVMVLDTTAPYAGLQSLRVNPAAAAGARTLAIAVPSTFWVRLYIKSDQTIGQTAENAFFGAGTSLSSTTGNYVNLAEQLGCVVLDKGGTLFPTDKTCGANAALAAGAWHCLVAEFDGATGNVEVFSGATQIINAAGWAPAKEAFNTFELGYFADNPNGATVWYDDVVVSSSPLTCP
jgi:hypothetical protein